MTYSEQEPWLHSLTTVSPWLHSLTTVSPWLHSLTTVLPSWLTARHHTSPWWPCRRWTQQRDTITPYTNFFPLLHPASSPDAHTLGFCCIMQPIKAEDVRAGNKGTPSPSLSSPSHTPPHTTHLQCHDMLKVISVPALDSPVLTARKQQVCFRHKLSQQEKRRRRRGGGEEEKGEDRGGKQTCNAESKIHHSVLHLAPSWLHRSPAHT